MLTLLLLLSGATDARGEEPRLVVGVIAPVSGDFAQYGEAVVNGMRLANDVIPGKPLQLAIEDNAKCDSPSAVSAFHKLTTFHQASVIVTVCTAAAQGVLPLTKPRGLPLIQLTESGPDPDNIMLKLMPDSVRMASLHGERYAEKYRRLAIIGTDIAVNVGERGNVPLVTRAFEARGGKVVLSELFPPDVSDFRSLIERIRRSNAEAVAPFIGSADSMALFLKQSDELKLWADVKLVGNFFFEFLFAELSKLYPRLSHFEGLESVNLSQMTDDAFKRAYEERYETALPQFADYGYDAVTILKRCGTDKKCYQTGRQGVSGPLTFDAEGRRTGAFDEKELRHGRFVKIRTTS